jgi:hypothetical protein
MDVWNLDTSEGTDEVNCSKKLKMKINYFHLGVEEEYQIIDLKQETCVRIVL